MMAALMVLSALTADAPDAKDIERLLHRKEFCFISVDACLDDAGRQILPNSRYEVSDIVCRKTGRPQGAAGAPVKRSRRCHFEVRQTSWIDGEQVGQAHHLRMTGIFDLLSFEVFDADKKAGHAEYWQQRRP